MEGRKNNGGLQESAPPEEETYEYDQDSDTLVAVGKGKDKGWTYNQWTDYRYNEGRKGDSNGKNNWKRKIKLGKLILTDPGGCNDE